MRSDQRIKILLVVFVVAVCAMAMSRLEFPAEAATTGQEVYAADSRQDRREPETRGAHAPTVTDMPLRWRIARARHESGNFNTYCGTEVVVTNLTGSPVEAKVEFLNSGGASEGVSAISLAAFDPDNVITNLNVEPGVTDIVGYLALGDFQGYALVYADDPRIMATARIYCRDATGSAANVVSDQMVPAYPVGASAEFFKAGMPGSWTPPMAKPELP
jgi:hypothetical protein